MTRRFLLIFPMFGAFAACGPTTTHGTNTPKSIASAAPLVTPPAEHPARWILHPSSPPPLHARVDLGATGVLYAGDDGARWLDHEGAPIASTTLLSESIAAIARTAETFEFVSTTGTVFVVSSSDPLGPAIATHAPPKKMRSVSAGKKGIFGVAEGALYRSTDAGETWSQVTSPAISATLGSGTLRQVAMLPNGDGLLLFAPQRVMATTDDGATWTAIATPGVGARRIVADANGDLMLEGLTASGILRMEPLRLEKIARAPAADPEMPMPTDVVAPAYAAAIDEQHAALVGEKYFELSARPTDDGAWHWSFGAGTLTDPPRFHAAPTFDGCTNVFLSATRSTQPTAASAATTLEVGCAREPRPNATGIPSKKIEEHWNLHFSRSDDDGKTWRDDGSIIAFEGGARRIFLAPDGTLLVVGGCKWSKQEWACDESPPVVRAPGGNGFAKVIGQPWTDFSDVVFAKNKAYALGTVNRAGRFALYVSQDGGKDFVRKPLPSTSDKKDSGEALVPELLSGTWSTSLTVDEVTGAALAAVPTAPSGTWVVYETKDDGVTFEARPVPRGVDQVQLVGRRGFAWSSDDKSFETNDGGVTWVEAEAPHARTPQVALACDAYGCMLGDFVTRIGWNDAPSKGATIAETPKNKPNPLSPITCTPVGNWTSLGAVEMPTVGNADLGGGTRFTLMKRDKDASTGALVGVASSAKSPGDVVETKTISLFGPAPKDSATYVTMQLEGVAALRYSFKRDTPSTKKPKTAPAWWGPVKKEQDVDVEIAWYLASDGKVHRATIKGAGPMGPTDVFDGRDKPSMAHVGVLSIAMGGIHVRPFKSSKPDAPLYFVSDAGKVETLTWPDLPTKDVRGKPLNFPADAVDAARIGKRSLVFGYPPLTETHPPGGVQVEMAWSSGTKASSWDLRAWGLWPHEDEGIVRLRYIDSGSTPAFVVLFDGLHDDVSASWMIPLKGPDADPSTPIALPTAAMLGDVPKACGKSDANSARFTLPAALDARHPLLVDGDMDLTMAVRESVVHVGADGKDFCVSAFDAVGIGKKTMEVYTALLPLDDLAHAALFRGKAGDVSSRAMKCTIDAGKPVPPQFESIEGFGK